MQCLRVSDIILHRLLRILTIYTFLCFWFNHVAGFRRRALRSSLTLSYFVSAIERAGPRKDVRLLIRPGARGPKVLGAKRYRDVPGGRSTLNEKLRTASVLLVFTHDKDNNFKITTAQG